jgi:hypothetical protein
VRQGSKRSRACRWTRKNNGISQREKVRSDKSIKRSLQNGLLLSQPNLLAPPGRQEVSLYYRFSKAMLLINVMQ